MDFIDDFLKTIQKDSPDKKGISYYCKHLNRFITLKGNSSDTCKLCSEEIKIKYERNKSA